MLRIHPDGLQHRLCHLLRVHEIPANVRSPQFVGHQELICDYASAVIASD